jgi:hypothetical protein
MRDRRTLGAILVFGLGLLVVFLSPLASRPTLVGVAVLSGLGLMVAGAIAGGSDPRPVQIASEPDSPRLGALRRLREDANEIVARLQRDGERMDDAVLLSQCWCYQAQHLTTDEGEGRFRVLLEGAAPDAFRFQARVRLELERRGWPNVEVSTEW